ncbi:acetoin utilization deacetylase AcuC-like enzyme [Yoonia maricola]|uniref:Acetoin utilization deacetylase AcuC-like enzyme n=1 Tax=Yoonia maricola TaxID=420999 RepID=A0A2M8WNU4_9RHOB|nr:class II histone deacetylase [Yoonia maricola]PJI92589.1 acetoin utilization deacetylase AcuC-like enzyme [Yoonia maricola]
MTTGFFWNESCFWHGGGNYAGMLPVGGLVQPLDGGLPESPETKRRLKNLIEVTGLATALAMQGADPATYDDLRRVHPARYLDEFKALSDAGGGELGRRTPFGPGGYEIAALSAGLAKAALQAVLEGSLKNAYALSRPPGHHCLPDYPNGFCLLNNIGIAIEAAKDAGLAQRFAVLDWDVHHGNGTEAVFYDRADVLTVSLHQDRNYPMDTGAFADRGEGDGLGFNLNIPLPPGTGHIGYLAAMERLALPTIRNFQPDVLIIACGFDAAANDPLGRMLATAETFTMMTRAVMALAQDVCGGKLLMVHEGGYSETYVPFCGHNVLQEMAGSTIIAPDPFAEVFPLRQPDVRFDAFLDGWLIEMEAAL